MHGEERVLSPSHGVISADCLSQMSLEISGESSLFRSLILCIFGTLRVNV